MKSKIKVKLAWEARFTWKISFSFKVNPLNLTYKEHAHRSTIKFEENWSTDSRVMIVHPKKQTQSIHIEGFIHR